MKMCITGGGTGGHLMIARALAEAAVSLGHEVIFIGSISGQDQKYFADDPLFTHAYFLQTTGVVNQKGLKKIQALCKVFLAFLKSRKILQEHNIEATYSVGGFSAAPAAFATLSKKLPLFIHEQNAVEGRLNALLKPYATRFISAYDESSMIKGYPVEKVFFEKARVREELKSIIFLGGSQGAKAINDLALGIYEHLDARGIKIIHQAGERDFHRVQKEYEKLGAEVELYGFSDDLASLVSRADLAVSRSGASTLWELCANGLPAFFVPYPFAAGDHQFYNAKFIVDENLGWCARESEELTSKLLLVLDENLKNRSEALLKYAKKDVAIQMIQDVEDAIQ